MAKLDEQDLIRMGLQTALVSAKSIKWYRGHLKKPLANAKKIYEFRDWTPQIQQAKAYSVKAASSVRVKALRENPKADKVMPKTEAALNCETMPKTEAALNCETMPKTEAALDCETMPKTEAASDCETMQLEKRTSGIGKTVGIAAAGAAVAGAAALGTWQVLKKSHG